MQYVRDISVLSSATSALFFVLFFSIHLSISLSLFYVNIQLLLVHAVVNYFYCWRIRFLSIDDGSEGWVGVHFEF